MIVFKRYLILISAILLAFAGNGCLKKPSLSQSDLGAVNITLSINEDSTKAYSRARATDIQSIKISLVHKNKKISKEQLISFSGNVQPISFDSLYPGEWQISAAALDAVGDTIFQGSTSVLIQPNNLNQANFPLTASPGVLSVSVDASQIPGFGTEFTKGTLYVYFDSGSNDTKYYTLITEGVYLKTEISIPEGSYQLKIAAPNVSSSVYTSPYYTVNISAGKKTSFSLSPNCSAAITGVIDSTPATPADFIASYHSESSTVSLTWSPVIVNDLAGYRLYRTDNEGRLIRLMTLQTNATSYADTVNTANFYQGTIGYAISSYDLGGNESFWSDAFFIKY